MSTVRPMSNTLFDSLDLARRRVTAIHDLGTSLYSMLRLGLDWSDVALTFRRAPPGSAPSSFVRGVVVSQSGPRLEVTAPAAAVEVPLELDPGVSLRRILTSEVIPHDELETFLAPNADGRCTESDLRNLLRALNVPTADTDPRPWSLLHRVQLVVEGVRIIALASALSESARWRALQQRMGAPRARALGVALGVDLAGLSDAATVALMDGLFRRRRGIDPIDDFPRVVSQAFGLAARWGDAQVRAVVRDDVRSCGAAVVEGARSAPALGLELDVTEVALDELEADVRRLGEYLLPAELRLVVRGVVRGGTRVGEEIGGYVRAIAKGGRSE